MNWVGVDVGGDIDIYVCVIHGVLDVERDAVDVSVTEGVHVSACVPNDVGIGVIGGVLSCELDGVVALVTVTMTDTMSVGDIEDAASARRRNTCIVTVIQVLSMMTLSSS